MNEDKELETLITEKIKPIYLEKELHGYFIAPYDFLRILELLTQKQKVH